MSKVELIYTRAKRYGEDKITGVKVLVDGKKIASGSFGGEPEDNSFERDYGWVDDALCGLTRALGAELIETEELDE